MERIKALLPKALKEGKRRLVHGLLGVLLVSLWCFIGFWSWWEQNSIMNATTLELEKLTTAVQEQTKGLFKQAETSLVVANHWIATHPNEDPATASDFIALVEKLRKTSEGLLDLRMVTRGGVLRYIPDRGQAKQMSVTDRDYFLAQSDPKTRGFYVASPVLSRVTGKWGIPISIPVENGGADTAVLFVAIELDRIAGTFEAERAKPNGAIAIVRSDGITMFRSPMDGKVLGTSIANSESWSRFLAVSPKGSFVSSASPLDNTTQIVSFATVSGYPLIAIATASKDDVLMAWKLHTALLSLVAVVVSVFCTLLGKALIDVMSSEAVVRNELEKLMLTDSLTGIGNRRMLTRWLDDEVVRAHRYQAPLTLVFIDLDHFKSINDTYGHGVGDQVLQRVAESVRSQLRQSDHVARYGGEEFVVLLVETGLPDALALVERMRGSIGRLQIPEMPRSIKASAGIAQLRNGETSESLLKRSDQALYKAKATGRDRSVVDDARPE